MLHRFLVFRPGAAAAVAVLLAAASLALFPPAAPAASAAWAAQWVSQSSYLTLESGETGTSWVQARNIGAMTWYDSFVLLGTSAPRDRLSRFQHPSWPSANRAAFLTPSSVPNGQVGRFTWQVKAPSVSAQTTFDEAFEPVADTPGGDWMGDNPPAGGRPWPLVFWRYTVVPAAPPSVRLLSVPDYVLEGDPVPVIATATDNRAVSQVEFLFAGHRTAGAESPDSNAYRATLPSAGLAPGQHSLVVRALDRVGLTADAGGTILVLPRPQDSSEPVVLKARFSHDWDVFRRGYTLAKTLRIRNAVAGTTVELSCPVKPRRCPFRRVSRTVRTDNQRVELGTYFRRRGKRVRLPIGTVVQVRVRKAGHYGKYARYTIRRRQIPREVTGCLHPLTAAATPCP